MKKCLLILLLLSFFSCKKEVHITTGHVPVKGLITENAMVVSARKEASEIGIQIMKKGGNAFDAMIATEMALAVAFPYAGNLGGGGFMVYRTEFGEIGALDFREKAPIEAYSTMFLSEDGEYISEKSKLGGLAVGVPGTIAGIFSVHEKFGTLPIEEVLNPVIDLAESGYVITKKQSDRFKKHREVIYDTNKDHSIFTDIYTEGDTLRNMALANTLRRISTYGRQEFYQGETGEKLVNYIQSRGGIITMDDLDAYETEWREPITFDYKDLKIISMSPPSSGGVCLAQILKSIEPYPISEYGHNSVKAIQLITEAERRSYADRSFFLGDPDFIDIPVDTLISDTYIQSRMGDFTFDNATPSQSISYGTIPGYESEETTHYSIIDQFGNAIAVTTTLNAAYGSKLYPKELGFFLNNEMDDFSAKPGEPNMFGLIGGEANAIVPHKRMLSSMTPTIIEKDGALWMCVGSPGGSKIITSVMQTILNVYEFDMNMQEAVNAPRFHHQWLPDVITFEPGVFSNDLFVELEEKGYSIEEKPSLVIGKVDAILIHDDGRLEGGADHRGDDSAAGF
jgi:gamma-glutamyltranspeptidase/glutathione hydrolase